MEPEASVKVEEEVFGVLQLQWTESLGLSHLSIQLSQDRSLLSRPVFLNFEFDCCTIGSVFGYQQLSQ